MRKFWLHEFFQYCGIQQSRTQLARFHVAENPFINYCNYNKSVISIIIAQ